MLNFRLARAIAVSVAIGFAAVQGPVAAQSNPPYVTLPVSGVSAGDTTTVSGANFQPGAVVTLKLSGPAADSWSQTLGVGSDGSISYPIRFNEEGAYVIEVLSSAGAQLAMIRVSSARHR